MTERTQYVSQVKIKVAGVEFPAEGMAKLREVTVDQHTHLPHMFVIRLQDPELKLLDEGPFDLAKEVEISASGEESGADSVVLIKGEITALEPEFNEAMISELVVRGYDKLHRLYRESKSKVFLNVKDSELAEKIAGEVGLQAEISPATSVVYDHIYQHNQSDLAFLMQRAWRIGYECFVEDGKLYFRKPENKGSEAELTWGDDLQKFHLRVTVAEQVEEVVVRGWDDERQQAIVGRASKGTLFAEVDDSKNGTAWAGEFGKSKAVIVDQPVVSQAEADALAEARLDEISGAFIEAEGVALRRPDIRAGKRMTLVGLGKRYSGKYLVTNATHRYTPEGHTTIFSVLGSRQGLLSEQLAQAAPQQASGPRWPSVVIGVVKNIDDPKKLGRVKVTFPWMSEEAESDWARVLGIGAGDETGFYTVPSEGDEVVVAFIHGDFNHPVVLGGLWNGMAAPPPEGTDAPSGSQSKIRTWHSQSGSRITLDDVKNEIVIKSDGTLKIDMGKSVEIKASGSIKIESSADVTIKGSVIDLNP